jgi:segregation and condensation protein B
MERSEQLRVVEALVLASPEPLSATRVAQIAPECTPALVIELVAELNEQYLKTERAFEIWEVAGGYQVRTRAEFSGYLQKLQKQRPLRLSGAALETLSIVAYKQPATRADIEHVRGVDVGAVVKSLLERGLMKIDGHKDVPGRPMLYSTTRRFLEVFGLQSIKNLPALRELEDLAREHGLENPDATDAAEPMDAEDNAEEGGEVVVDGEDEQLDLSAESFESPDSDTDTDTAIDTDTDTVIDTDTDTDTDAPEFVTAAADDSDEGLHTEDLGEDEEASPAFDDEMSAGFDDESSSELDGEASPELDGEASPELDGEASPDLDEEASFQDDAQESQADDENDGGAQTRTIEIASERDALEGELDPDGEEPEIVLPSSE